MVRTRLAKESNDRVKGSRETSLQSRSLSSRDGGEGTSPSQESPGRDCWRRERFAQRPDKSLANAAPDLLKAPWQLGMVERERDETRAARRRVKWFPRDTSCEAWLAGFVVPQNGTLASLASPDGGAPCPSFGSPQRLLPDEPAARRRSTRPARRDIWLCC